MRAVLRSDTVLASVHASVLDEVNSGQFVPLSITNAPPLYSAMGVVSLRGRSHSPVAEVAIERLTKLVAPYSAMDRRFMPMMQHRSHFQSH